MFNTIDTITFNISTITIISINDATTTNTDINVIHLNSFPFIICANAIFYIFNIIFCVTLVIRINTTTINVIVYIAISAIACIVNNIAIFMRTSIIALISRENYYY